MRQLVSHLSGIRHYTKKKDEKEAAETENEKKDESGESKQSNESKTKKWRNGNGGGGNSGDTQFKEFYLNEKFESVTQALTIFKDDELLSKPGEWPLLD